MEKSTIKYYLYSGQRNRIFKARQYTMSFKRASSVMYASYCALVACLSRNMKYNQFYLSADWKLLAHSRLGLGNPWGCGHFLWNRAILQWRKRRKIRSLHQLSIFFTAICICYYLFGFKFIIKNSRFPQILKVRTAVPSTAGWSWGTFGAMKLARGIHLPKRYHRCVNQTLGDLELLPQTMIRAAKSARLPTERGVHFRYPVLPRHPLPSSQLQARLTAIAPQSVWLNRSYRVDK